MFGIALSFPLVALLAIGLWRYGIGIIPRTWVHVAVALLLGAAALSTVVAANGYIGVHGARASYQGLTHFLELALVYLAVSIAVRTEDDAARLLAMVAALPVASFILAAIQRSGDASLDWATVRELSTLGSPAFFAQLVAVVAAIGVGAVLFAPGRLTRRLRIAATLIALAAIGWIGLLAARSALAALAAVGIGAVILAGSRLGARVLLRPAPLLGSGALLLAVAIAIGITPLGARIQATLEGTGFSDRALLYGSALEAIRDRPLLGFGPDNFGVAYPMYRQIGSAEILSLISETSTHNLLLQAAVTVGVVGVFALLLFIAGVLWQAWRGRTAVGWVVASCALGCVGYWTYALFSPEVVALTWIPWAFAGVIVGLSTAPGPVHPRIVPPALAGIVILLSVVTAASGATALAADRDARSSADARAAERADDAIRHAQRSVAADPARAQYWHILGLAYASDRRWAQAGSAFEEAIEREPHDVTYRTNLARARLLAALAPGAPAAARESAFAAARSAIETDPNDPEPHFVYAQVANGLGDHEGALRACKAAIYRFRQNGDYDKEASAAALRMTDIAQAESLLRDIVALKPDSAVLRLALAQILLKAGNKAGAIAELRELLRRTPGHPDASTLLQRLESQ